MSILFDESNDYYVITDSASMTLPDGDWCVGIFTRVVDSSGNAYQYLISNNNFNAVESFNFFFREDSVSDPDHWQSQIRDTGSALTLDTTGTPAFGSDGLWRLFITSKRGSGINGNFKFWSCVVGKSPIKHADIDDTGAVIGAVNGGDWNIGRRVDGNADRYYGSFAGEFFKGNFSLSADEITRLASGRERPFDVLRKLNKQPDVYLEMRSADYKLYDISGNGNHATRQDAPVTKEHPIVMRRRVWPVAAVASTAGPLVNSRNRLKSKIGGALV